MAVAAVLAALALTSCGGETPPSLETLSPPPAASASPTPSPAPAPASAPDGSLDEAYALLRAGLYGEAAVAFAELSQRATDPAAVSVARLGEAVAAYEAGDAARSLALVRLALTAAPPGSPEEARAVYLLGSRLNEGGDFAEAVALLRPHAVLGSGLALAPFIVAEYASALAGNGNGEGAGRVWRALLATPALQVQLGVSVLRQSASLARANGDLEARRRWLGELAALTGEAQVRHELAAVAFLLDDLELFETQLRAIVVERPATPEALLAIRDLRDAGFAIDAGDEGYVLYRHRAFAEARAVLAAGLGEPGLAEAALAFRTYYLAAAYDDAGFFLESIPLYDIVAASPGAGVFAHRARYWAARALESAGRHEEAARRYDAIAVEADAGEFVAESAFRSGFVRLRAGDVVGAVAAFEVADVRGGGDARTRYWLGRAHAMQGQEEAAREAFRRAAETEPHSFHGLEARRALGETVAVDGRYRPLPPPPPTDWDAIAVWLAGRVPGAPGEGAPEAVEFALAGLMARAAESIASAVARTDDPWELLALARTATAAGLPRQSSAIAFQLLATLGLTTVEAPARVAALRYPLPYAGLLEANGRAHGLDPLLLAALVHQESRWDAEAVSIAGALGLTQVIPSTAAAIAAERGRTDFLLADLFRPAVSLEFGAHYLGRQLAAFGDIHQALAAYNGGPANVARWVVAMAGGSPADFVEAITFAETRGYVQRVMEHYTWYRALYGVGGGG